MATGKRPAFAVSRSSCRRNVGDWLEGRVNNSNGCLKPRKIVKIGDGQRLRCGSEEAIQGANATIYTAHFEGRRCDRNPTCSARVDRREGANWKIGGRGEQRRPWGGTARAQAFLATDVMPISR